MVCALVSEPSGFEPWLGTVHLSNQVYIWWIKNVHLIGHSQLGLFRDQYKQTMINKYSNKHNLVKNPSWQEADVLAIYKRSWEVELRATQNNISRQSEWDFDLGPTDFKSSALTTWSGCLPLGVTLQWTSIPSRQEGESRNTSSHFMPLDKIWPDAPRGSYTNMNYPLHII